METWAVITLVLGTNIITSLVTWFITKIQLKHSEEQLKKQLEAQREADSKERRRQIRSQPLLELRGELACMAAKQRAIVNLGVQLRPGARSNKEKAKEKLRQVVEDWDSYQKAAKLDQALFMQDDYELAVKVDKIQRDYQKSCDEIFGGEADEIVNTAIENSRGTNKEVNEVQELINKRLEEL